jgi:HD-like signal output (HDOD) protein/ActR/RegA family two-component response regulator
MSRRVMFVDDEPHLLSGLRRGLGVKRRDWELVFATGGSQALDLMADQPVDVVISDMRMPGMDGAQLLAEVRNRFPATARIILSGHADRESIISAVGPTQQYLTKPCEVDAVIVTVERMLKVQDLIHDSVLRELLGGIESLPKPPDVYDRMMEISADPEASLNDVVAVIEQDLATSTEVLRLVNSSFFGLPVRVESLARAVSLLGLETIQGLAVAGAVFGAGGTPPPGIDPSRLCRQGLQVGMLAKRMAVLDEWTPAAQNDMFFAGLLHRVALPVLAAACPQEWSGLRADPAPDPFVQDETEASAFGRSVSTATAYLLGLWGFSETIVEAIAAQPATIDDPSVTPTASVLTLARWEHLAPGVPAPPENPDPGAFLTAERWSQWNALRQQVTDDQEEREPVPDQS